METDIVVDAENSWPPSPVSDSSVDSRIRVRGLAKRFGAVPVLRGLDLDLMPGRITALLGANGAGKTTVVGVLSGLVREDAGEIWLGPERFDRHRSEHRARIGVLSHDTFLYPTLTVAENLSLHARIQGLGEDRVRELIGALGLERFSGRWVCHLSRGWRQRVAIARALLHRPSLLLLDEPFSGLDLHAVDVLEALIRDLVAPERTILLTTHDSRVVGQLADRAVVLHRGRVVAQGSAAEITEARLREIWSVQA